MALFVYALLQYPSVSHASLIADIIVIDITSKTFK